MCVGGGERRGAGGIEAQVSPRQGMGETAGATGCLEPGHLFILDEEVQELRERLLSQGIVPRLTLKDPTRIKSLTHKKCVVNALPPKWQQIETWCGKLGVPICRTGAASNHFSVAAVSDEGS